MGRRPHQTDQLGFQTVRLKVDKYCLFTHFHFPSFPVYLKQAISPFGHDYSLGRNSGKLAVNDSDQTNVKNIYAIGDISTGGYRKELTPVAIEAGVLLARRLFAQGTTLVHTTLLDSFSLSKYFSSHFDFLIFQRLSMDFAHHLPFLRSNKQ